ncbi:hypothetical protein SOVF_197180 isoform B [Spinacia oleracea]|nr:hypothetical protein SOVF_197180 isoform A [Spinacia oleracea]KNA04709.1 hypothetical protein SOVF_197180 isoform B [Spinacia oleracea]
MEVRRWCAAATSILPPISLRPHTCQRSLLSVTGDVKKTHRFRFFEIM